MPTQNDFKEIDNKIKGIEKNISSIENDIVSLKEDVEYLKEHLAQYYIHFVNFTATLPSNVRIECRFNVFNNVMNPFADFKAISDRYSSSVKFACGGYVKLASGTFAPIISVLFRGNVADVYYYDSQTQSTTYASVNYEQSQFYDDVKEV